VKPNEAQTVLDWYRNSATIAVSANPDDSQSIAGGDRLCVSNVANSQN